MFKTLVIRRMVPKINLGILHIVGVSQHHDEWVQFLTSHITSSHISHLVLECGQRGTSVYIFFLVGFVQTTGAPQVVDALQAGKLWSISACLDQVPKCHCAGRRWKMARE